MADHHRRLQPLHYDDLLLLLIATAAHASSSDPPPPPHHTAAAPPPIILHQILHSLGPHGPGLLAIHGVPGLHSLRQALLPFARALALLPAATRSTILKNHDLGTDVPLKDPHRSVSSFATQLEFGPDTATSSSALESASEFQTAATTERCRTPLLSENSNARSLQCCPLSHVGGFNELGNLFRQLGADMIGVGLLVARLCDIAIQGAKLQEAILDSRTAKGRLIHYHSLQETSFLRTTPDTVTKKKVKHQSLRASFDGEVGAETNFWQQWHFDYGIFTILTVPMFLSSLVPQTYCDEQIGSADGLLQHFMSAHECEAPNGHTCLKILNTAKLKVELVSVPEDCLILQVGEAAQILTNGKLRATAHCVCRPVERGDVSRETFVVFLQPSWEKALVPPEALVNAASVDTSSNEFRSCWTNIGEEEKRRKQLVEIQTKIPPLESRWKAGCTFAEFSRQTTKLYYGTDGVQTRK